MGYKTVEIEIDLEEFDTDDLLDELESRTNKSDVQLINDFCEDHLGVEPDKRKCSISLLDQMKIDLLMSNINKITLNDLEKLL